VYNILGQCGIRQVGVHVAYWW